MPAIFRKRSKSEPRNNEGHRLVSLDDFKALNASTNEVPAPSAPAPPPPNEPNGQPGPTNEPNAQNNLPELNNNPTPKAQNPEPNVLSELFFNLFKQNETLQRQLQGLEKKIDTIEQKDKVAPPPKPKEDPELAAFRTIIQSMAAKNLAKALEELSEDNQKTLLHNPNVLATIQDPHGGLLFEAWVQAKQSLTGIRPGTDEMIKVCDDYIEGKRANDLDIENSVEQAVLGRIAPLIDLKCKETRQDCITDFYHITETPKKKLPLLLVMPPTKFSQEEHTFRNDQRAQTIYKAYDTNKAFSGKNNGKTVVSWLKDLNQRQTHLMLTEHEFQDFLLRASSGEANETITNAIEQKCSLYEIYQRLLTQYEYTMAPKVATDKAKNYKATKDNSLIATINEIEIIARAMSKKFKNHALAVTYFNRMAPEILIESLPLHSQQTASKIYEKLSEKCEDDEPLWKDFVNKLYAHQDSFNRDIASEGKNPNFNGKIEAPGAENSNINKNDLVAKPMQNPFFKSNGSVKMISQVVDQPTMPNSFAVNNMNQNQSNQSLDLPGKKYCGHCGKNNHTAADPCFAIFDDTGRKIMQGLVSRACPNCTKLVNKSFFHPESLCPLRPKALELYKSRDVIPIGIFNKYFKDNFPTFARHLFKPRKLNQNNNNQDNNQKVQKSVNNVNVNQSEQNKDLTNFNFSVNMLKISKYINETNSDRAKTPYF